ncbi:hypothetical protein ACFV2H_00950 [Streptomyces sp. NPDC059629]|uniref:hypothetical protein n=1 Tax=Streptomyces sp. NPDC059629 TaxID=3346889 RepID=UPI0036850C91
MTRQAVDTADPSWTLAAWERGLREDPLDRAVTLLSTVAGLGREDAERTELGVRDAMLATALERLTAGTAIWGCVRCARCGEQLDVPVHPAALPRGPRYDPARPLEVEVAGVRIAFRLPDTGDLRALAGTDDPRAGRWLLLARCLPDGADGIDEEAAALIEAAMEEASPGASVTLAVDCPVCAASTVAALDIPALLWAQVQTRALTLLHEVHVLARAYGWTEPDVLALGPVRRAAYLELAAG